MLAIGLVTYALLAMPTAVGGWQRHRSVPVAIADGLAWPLTWVTWFVRDNRAAGRSWFEGRAR